MRLACAELGRRRLHAGLALIAMFGSMALTQRSSAPLLQYLTVGTARIEFLSPDGTVAHFRFVDQALGRARRPGASADDRPMSACYRTSADTLAGPMTLLFESDEMGNPEDLTEFELIPIGSRPEAEHGCVKLTAPASAVVTDRGIRLGLTRAMVTRLLGAPVRDHGAVAEYELKTEQAVRTGGSVDRIDLFSSLTVTFRSGRVVAFSGAIGDTD